jgi:hypothetical protein
MLGAMFTVSDAEATAIQDAYEQSGELAAAVELRRLFPGIIDNVVARECVRMIIGWRRPAPEVVGTAPVLPVKVNRAPVLTLWATVVAERLGYPTDTALTLGRAVCGSSARVKARSIGIIDEAQEAAERADLAAQIKPGATIVRLLGTDIPVLAATDGTLRAADKGKPASARSVAAYVSKAFGDRLAEARAAMEALAASLPPEELNRVGFRLYERFRPDVLRGAQGWGAKGELDPERIRTARQ